MCSPVWVYRGIIFSIVFSGLSGWIPSFTFIFISFADTPKSAILSTFPVWKVNTKSSFKSEIVWLEDDSSKALLVFTYPISSQYSGDTSG